jgi:hypothetical protein
MSSLCIIQEDLTEIIQVEEVTSIIKSDDVHTVVVAVGPTVLVREEPTIQVVDDRTPIPIIAECKVGPSGADGADGLDGFGIVQVDTGPAANGVTLVADSVAIATFRSAKWLVTIKDSTAGDYKFYEVIAVHNGTTPLYSVYGNVGDTISVFTDVTIVSGFLRLEITNNSTNSIDISVMRIVTTV